MGFPGGSVGKNLPANAEDTGSIPGSERSPGEGNGNPLEYSCLETSMDGGAWKATDHGDAELDTTGPVTEHSTAAPATLTENLALENKSRVATTRSEYYVFGFLLFVLYLYYISYVS